MMPEMYSTEDLPHNHCCDNTAPPSDSLVQVEIGEISAIAIRLLGRDGHFSWCPVVNNAFVLPADYEDCNTVIVRGGQPVMLSSSKRSLLTAAESAPKKIAPLGVRSTQRGQT
jgi:hypothetical protein